MIWVVRYATLLLLVALSVIVWLVLDTGSHCYYDILDYWYVRPLPCIDYIGGYQ